MHKTIVAYVLFMLALFALNNSAAFAQSGRSTGQLLKDVAGEVLMDNVGFSEEEKRIIRGYYGRSTSGGDYSSGDYDGRYRRSENYNSERHANTNGYRDSDWRDRRDDDDDDGHYSGKKKKKKKKGKGKKGLPPGLAKRDDLPPGLQKQLEKNGTLPPGLAKRDLPDDLERRLPRRRDGVERTRVEDDIVLIEKATGRILDIFYGGARRN